MIIKSPMFGIFNILFDKEDLEKVQLHTWCVQKCWNKNSNLTPHFYASATVYDSGKGKTRKTHSVLMHRYLMDAPKGKSVDHINAITDNENDNRKFNLRICTQSENRQNYKGINPNNTSGYLGVTWSKKHEKWQAYVHGKDKYYNMGLYDNIEDAVAARRRGEELYFTIHNDVVA